MIKNNIALLLLVFGLFCFTSCEDEFEKPFEQASLEAAHLELGSAEPAFFNKGDFANAASTFNVQAIGDGGVTANSVDVIAYRKNAVTNAQEGPVSVGSLSSASGDFTVTLADLAAGFGLAEADINVGDIFTFFFEMQTSAGTIVQGGPAGDRSISLPVSCPSELAGTYNATATGTSTDVCCPDETTVTSVVTLTDNGGGVYTFSDFSGGLYFEWYDIYGITETNSPADLLDVCNTISFVSTTEPFGETLTGSGSVDATTGVITYTWLTGYGDTGNVVLTPQ